MSSKLIPVWEGVRFSQMSSTAPIGLKVIDDPLYIKLSLRDAIDKQMQVAAKVGDRVACGSLIATGGENGTPIYSSIAGTVAEIGAEKRPDGTEESFVLIRGDGSARKADAPAYDGMLADAAPDALIGLAKRAGITERDGLPLWQNMAQDTEADFIVINAVMCEPDDRVCPEMISAYPEHFLCGIKIILKAVGKRHAVIVLSDSMKAQADLLLTKITDDGDDKLFSIELAADRYPMYENAQLAAAVGDGPAVFDALACIELFTAFSGGNPATWTAVTVCGDAIRIPQTLIVPIGTEISVLAENCGGYRERPVRIICGGQMCGTVCRENDHVGRDTRLIRFDGSVEKNREKNCIRCGRCVSVCPAKVAPLYLSKYSKKKNTDKCRKLRIDACIDCGCCSYVCPSKIPLAQNIREGKKLIPQKRDSDSRVRKSAKKGG